MESSDADDEDEEATLRREAQFLNKPRNRKYGVADYEYSENEDEKDSMNKKTHRKVKQSGHHGKGSIRRRPNGTVQDSTTKRKAGQAQLESPSKKRRFRERRIKLEPGEYLISAGACRENTY